ncbi:hypothetical protein IID20_03815 [Patescibacteria group bacterium]|nr:hypothetical protein [Patescibacteria group bacterium]
MTEKIKRYEKYSPEDIKFFNQLAEKYEMKQTIEYLILKNEDGREHYIPKMYKNPSKNDPNGIEIEDFIKKLLAGEEI